MCSKLLDLSFQLLNRLTVALVGLECPLEQAHPHSTRAANAWTYVLQKYLSVVAKWLTMAVDIYTILIFNLLHLLFSNATLTADVAIGAPTESHNVVEL